jgi:hypothetical protein
MKEFSNRNKPQKNAELLRVNLMRLLDEAAIASERAFMYKL